MIRYHAAWVLPIAQRPIRDGWVEIEGYRIVGLGAGHTSRPADHVADLGGVAILPGLVNAHTHLELSYLGGRIPAATEFVDWIRGVVSTRRTQPDPRSLEIVNGIALGIAKAVAAGTALVGDISNTMVTVEALKASALAGVVFHELIRFNAPQPEQFVADACDTIDACITTHDVRVSLAAHAPYSVAPSVFRALHAAARSRGRGPVSVHLAESPAEIEFIARGTGPWRTFLNDVGAWDPAWQPSGATPVEYLDTLGVLDRQSVVVHGVQMTDRDLALLARRGATLVACPRSNVHTGAGIPPVEAFYASGVRVAVGTDSLASTADLNVFAELAALRRIAPTVPPGRLLESATKHGADALGFSADYGTLEPGKRGRLLAVSITPGIDDVEEYLVGGIEPSATRWLDDIAS